MRGWAQREVEQNSWHVWQLHLYNNEQFVQWRKKWDQAYENLIQDYWTVDLRKDQKTLNGSNLIVEIEISIVIW